MIASLYPDFELTNQFLQSSLDQAFSKYLQSQPARLKLIDYEIDREEEYRDTQAAFCLKSAVVDCFKDHDSWRDGVHMDFLKQILVAKHAKHFIK